MLHGFPEVMLQTMRHKTILYGLQEVESECQVFSHGQVVTSMVSMVVVVGFVALRPKSLRDGQFT